MKQLKELKKSLNNLIPLLIFILFFIILYGCKQENIFIIENNELVDFTETIVDEESIVIPEGVTSISTSLAQLINLKTIELPSSFEDFDYRLFQNCTNLQQINFAIDNSHYSSIDGVVFTKNLNILLYYPEGKTNFSYTINNPTIGTKAFYNNKYIKYIIMTEKVLKINKAAFENCINLESVVLSPNILELPSFAFKNCRKLNTITITEKIKSIGEQTFANNTSLINLTIPKNILYIQKEAFFNFTSSQTIAIDQPCDFILWDLEWKNYSQAKIIYFGSNVSSSLYLALGDSVAAGHMSDNTLSKGYADYLGEKLVVAQMATQFHNDFAKSGMSSSGLLYRLEHPDLFTINDQTIIEEIAKANYITISIGANDLLAKLGINFNPFSLSYDATEIFIAFTQLRNNYISIIDIIRSYNQKAQIYLISYYMPLPYFSNSFSLQDYEMFQKLDETIADVAYVTNTYFVDISSVSSITNIPNPINIHPGESGYQFISDIIFKKMVEINK
ncbi:MAG: leucine-rich repeat protein [Bacilli bacterium]